MKKKSAENEVSEKERVHVGKLAPVQTVSILTGKTYVVDVGHSFEERER